jgi:hypothetical protein
MRMLLFKMVIVSYSVPDRLGSAPLQSKSAWLRRRESLASAGAHPSIGRAFPPRRSIFVAPLRSGIIVGRLLFLKHGLAPELKISRSQ